MSIFHRHKWALVWKGPASFDFDSVLFHKGWTASGIVKLWKCIKCGQEEARFIEANNDFHILSPDYVRQKWAIKEEENG